MFGGRRSTKVLLLRMRQRMDVKLLSARLREPAGPHTCVTARPSHPTRAWDAGTRSASWPVEFDEFVRSTHQLFPRPRAYIVLMGEEDHLGGFAHGEQCLEQVLFPLGIGSGHSIIKDKRAALACQMAGQRQA